MKLKKIIVLLFVISIFPLKPIKVDAYAYKTSSISSTFFILDEEDIDIGFNENDYNNDQNCNSIFGNPNDEESVAWLIQEALNIIRIVGPLLVLVLSSFDFIKVILNGDEKAMKDAQRKLGIRLILAACLLALPSIVAWLLEFFKITNSTCGIN